MFGRYIVDVKTERKNTVTLTTHFFEDYEKAKKFYRSSKAKDNRTRYTYSVAMRSF